MHICCAKAADWLANHTTGEANVARKAAIKNIVGLDKKLRESGAAERWHKGCDDKACSTITPLNPQNTLFFCRYMLLLMM